jgi:predicted MFS family arabinose efflux permease
LKQTSAAARLGGCRKDGAYLATVRFVPESRDDQATGRFDWLGSLVVAAAVAGLAFGTIRGQQHGWSEPIAMVSLAVGAVAAIAIPLLMTRRRDPVGCGNSVVAGELRVRDGGAGIVTLPLLPA